MDRLPSWRSWIALLIGIAVSIGAFVLSSEETRVGVRSTNVTIDDRSEYFDRDELQAAIDDVTWGRSMRVLVAVIPLSSLPPSDDCAQDWVTCLQPLYPSYFPTARVESDAAVLWIDPGREMAAIRMGTLPSYRSETFSQSEFDIARVLSYRAASGELTEESVTDAFQLLSDIEADVSSGRSWTDYLLALAAGAIAALLVGLILNAAQQSRAQRRQAHGFAKLSKSELNAVVDRVFDTYREATSHLDEIELVRASKAGRYEKTLDLRVRQYQRRYVQLARTIFKVQHLERVELTKTAHLPDLVILDRLAAIVREAEQVLRADERLLALTGRRPSRAPITAALADHPSIKHLKAALDAAAELAELTGDERLIKALPALGHDLEQAGADTPEGALIDLDDLARRFATIADPVFVAYAGEHGREYARRAEIEDPFRYRTLELTRSNTSSGKKSRRKLGKRRSGAAKRRDVSSAQVKQNLEERLAAAKVEHDAGSFKVPVSPIIIMLAAALAIGAGGIYLVLNPVGDGEITDAEESAVTIPETIVDSPEQANGAIAIPDGADFDDLELPGLVEVIDEAGIFDDPEALEEAISLIPMPGPVNYVVLTTNKEVPMNEHGSYLDPALVEIFPDYYEPLGDDYAMVSADDTMIVWFADSGNQVGFDLDLSSELDEDYNGRSRVHSVINNSYPSFELQVWDTLAGFSTGARGIGLDASDSTLESGASNVTGAVTTAVIAFGIFVVLLPQMIKPLVMRRRCKAWQEELTTTMTALTLAHEALSLDIDMVALEHRGYDARARLDRWNKDYLDVLRLTINATDTALSLEAQLRLARTVREQAESLWRIRPILELKPTWRQAWENESSALYAALEPGGSSPVNEIAGLTPQLEDRTLSPVQALSALDEIAAKQTGTARLRCVEPEDSGDPEIESATKDKLDQVEISGREDQEASVFSSPLMVDSRNLAQTPLFSLAPKDSIDIGIGGSSSVGAGETVQDIAREQETAKAFFSIDTSATRWLQSVGKSAVGTIRGLHEQSPSQITKTLFIYTGIGITALISIQIVGFIIGDGRDTTRVEVEESAAPLSVTYVNEGGEELPDELIDRFTEAELGAPVNLLIYSTSGECTYGTIEDQGHLADKAPLAVANLYERVRPHTSGVVLCLGTDSARVETAMNLDVGEAFDDAVFDYRFYREDEMTHEDWLTDWLDDPDRGTAFMRIFNVVKQIDSAIR